MLSKAERLYISLGTEEAKTKHAALSTIERKPGTGRALPILGLLCEFLSKIPETIFVKWSKESKRGFDGLWKSDHLFIR